MLSQNFFKPKSQVEKPLRFNYTTLLPIQKTKGFIISRQTHSTAFFSHLTFFLANLQK